MVPSGVGEALRSLACGGEPLAPALRAVLEAAFATDLRAVRIHHDARTDQLAQALQADAFACGAHVVVRSRCFAPDTDAGRLLIAHEIVHVLQQARRRPAPDRTHPPRVLDSPLAERSADALGARALHGGLVVGGASSTPPAGLSDVIQRHVSYEHRLLGDGPTPDLIEISTHGSRRDAILANQIALLQKWQYNPDSVTERDVQALSPWIRTLRLGPDNVLVTYGELNALPDYLSNPIALDTLPAAITVPVLQCIRQEGYNQLTLLRSGRNPNVTFARAAAAPWKLSMVNALVETMALDSLTFGLGINGSDHYQGLLARNACHFAPFSWYRWQANHIIARDLARRAHNAPDSGERARLTHDAWVFHGYADHFLQDSFAAGHLVNKTLVMQWFVEWAAGQSLLPVADWDRIKNMTAKQQPGLAGSQLYDPNGMGPSNDPQTADEQLTFYGRLAATGIAGAGDTYQQFLTFMTSAAAQLASASLHDHYNATSAWVSSLATPTPYEVWGDDTLLTGANGRNGVQATSSTAHLSQQALLDILANGSSSITTEAIRRHFPNRAGSSSTNVTDLRTWNEQQKSFAFNSFSNFVPTLKTLLTRFASPRLGIPSRDFDFSEVWNTSLPDTRYKPVEVLLYR
ncbi:MAG TPA: DUF4157 domain-containing protein [Candidatus Sulfotelmatobacter sp.]|nr:DUF4157 domain-containing protein [Candidatus Sulfotelmatobacter sp.]